MARLCMAMVTSTFARSEAAGYGELTKPPPLKKSWSGANSGQDFFVSEASMEVRCGLWVPGTRSAQFRRLCGIRG